MDCGAHPLSPHERNGAIRLLASILIAAFALAAAQTVRAGAPRPTLLARISRDVFGSHARAAECIAHFESTDGAHLFNGSNLGPWQDNVGAHPWIDARRIVRDWRYAAKVTFRISRGGTDWSPWTTHGLCGV